MGIQVRPRNQGAVVVVATFQVPKPKKSATGEKLNPGDVKRVL